MTQQSSDFSGDVVMVYTESLVTLGIQASLAYSALASLLVVQVPILTVGNPESSFPLLDDTTGFTSRIQAARRSVFLVELRGFFLSIADFATN